MREDKGLGRPLAVLGLGPGASPDEVRVAYRRLAKRCHPDASGDPGTAERFARVARAYKILSARAPELSDAGPSSRFRRVLEAGDDLFTLGQILTADPDPEARELAARKLGLTGRIAAYVFLRRALYDASERVQGEAVRAVSLLGARQAEGEVAALYGRASQAMRSLILEVAEATGEPLFTEALVAAKSDQDPLLRSRARAVLDGLRR